LNKAGHRSFIGETSVQVLFENAGTMRNIINSMKPIRSDAILLVVSNPVDILTTLALEISGLPKTQIIGSGTFVDCVRLRGFLAEQTGVSLVLVACSVCAD
jgi:L-lactate dehydrogenase